MTRNVIKVKRTADLREGLRILFDNKISGVPVADGEYRVIGGLSGADILVLAGMPWGRTFQDILRCLPGEPVPAGKTGNRFADVISFFAKLVETVCF